MSDTLAPRSPAESVTAWSHTLDPFVARRRPTRTVYVGDVAIGGQHPVRIQSMTVADTLDTARVVDEIGALAAAGCEIVRVTAPNRTAALNLAVIKSQLAARGVRVPLVADIHFTPQAALIAADHVEKVRINPGNFADRKHFEKWEYTDGEYAEELERLEAAFRPLVLRCKERGIAMRIGTNHGSLSDRILNRYGDTPLGMVESALEFVRICEHHGYRELVLSMKASDVKIMIEAYRLLAARMRNLAMDYPFHIGVTEAGAGFAARIKSSIGIAALLADGIGDTVRVSLTEDAVQELPLARALAARAPALEMPAKVLGRDTILPPWDPTQFARRVTAPIGSGVARLGSDQPPRVEIVLDLKLDPPPQVVNAIREACAGEPFERGADLVLLAPPRTDAAAAWSAALQAVAVWVATRPPLARPALGLELPMSWLVEPGVRAALDVAWARLALVVDETALAVPPPDIERLPPLQYTLSLEPDAFETAAQSLAAWPAGAVALDGRAALAGPHAWRRWLATCGGPATPVVLRVPRSALDEAIDPQFTSLHLAAAAAFGALLADGVGDAIQAPVDGDAAGGRQLGYELLQATRLRLSKADFIACPSCGRTQFDLQSTTQRIEARLQHLKELKIAVMGCIVNGPGEMADADFGYVGSGPGKIDLYVGHERIERGVPEGEAVERLVSLIRERGLWVDPVRV